MGRPKDTFWNYAHPESNKRFKCNFCDKIFPGGISRVKSHLSGIKGRDIGICLKVPHSIQAEAKQAIESPPCKKKGKKTISISDDDDEIVVVEDEPSISSSSSKKKELDKQFMNCYQIIKDGVSKEASQLFVQFVKDVRDYGPNYELPNFLTPDEQILEYERDVKESWSETGFTLMITLVDQNNVVVVGDDSEVEVNYFAYCPKGMLFLTSGKLSTAYTDVSRVITEFGDHRCLQVIALDNCIESFGLALMIKEKYAGVLLRSLSPIKIIHDLIEDFVMLGNGFELLLEAVEIVFTYMWNFSLEWRRKIFKEWKKHKGFECTYPVFYSDKLSLLRPIMEHEAEVVRAAVQSSQHISNWVAHVVTTARFWTLGKELIHIIDILFPLVCLGQGMVPAFGYFYEAVNKACDALDECYHKNPTSYKKLKSWGWVGTLRRMIIKPIHAAACFLNPAIMCSDNFKEDLLMMEGIDYLAENFFVQQVERISFLDQVELYRTKTLSIFTATASKKSKTLHPWAWWHEFGDSVPVLQKCAIQILSQPCGVPPEILDLPTANASDRRKTKLLLIEKFSGLQPSSLEPINLDCRQTAEYDKQKYLDDLSTSSNAGAALGLKTLSLDPETIDLSKYQHVHDFFCFDQLVCPL